MSTESSHLHDVIDAEIAEVEASADLVENDDPERAPYEIRLHALHEAVIAVEGPVTSRTGDRSLPATPTVT